MHPCSKPAAGGLAALAAVALAAGLSACGKPPSGGKAEQPGGATYQIKDASGRPARLAVTGAGVQPSTPAFAPLYPGARVEQTINGASGSGSGGMVIFRTAASPQEVVAYYRQKAASAGFGNVFSSEAGSGRMFTAGREGGEEGFQVTATPDRGETSVVLTWTNPRKG
jgi:hypothetical protein